jgi:hypothetical protein
MGVDAAIDRIRSGIRHLNDCTGVPNTPDRGYHETLTVFWVRIIRKLMDTIPSDTPLDDVIERVVAAYGARSDLFRDYYSFDVVKSREARAYWIPPDKRTL